MKNETKQPRPGRDLDLEVAGKLGRFTVSVIDHDSEPDKPRSIPHVPQFSTDITATMPLAIQYKLSLIPLEDGRWFCGQFDTEDIGPAYFAPEDGVIDGRFKDGYAVGTTPAHAICLVLLGLADRVVNGKELP